MADRKKIYSLADIRHALKDRNIAIVAKNTGISISTLYPLARGELDNLKYNNYVTLAKYLFNVDIDE